MSRFIELDRCSDKIYKYMRLSTGSEEAICLKIGLAEWLSIKNARNNHLSY